MCMYYTIRRKASSFTGIMQDEEIIQAEYFNKTSLIYFIYKFLCVKMIEQCLIILFKLAEYVIILVLS